jgi:LacI family transcriptional regulator
VTISIRSTEPAAPGKTASAPSTTISDVARSAGVSIKTVSRVMNNEAGVHPETRARVRQVMADLRYRPSQSARSLAGARSFLIGLLYFDPSAAFVAGVQQGATMRCREAGYHLVVESMNDDAPDLREQVHLMVSTLRPDGMILTPPLCDNPHVLKALRESGTPTVLVSPLRQRKDMLSVRMDDVHAAEEITQLLLGLGHRRIAFIRGPANQAASALRHQGFVNAMQAADIEVEDELVVEGDFRFDSGVAATHQLLKLRHRPTAVFASNDDMALGVLAAAQRQGLAIPGDLAIAGFDDSPASSLVWPPLTTVRQPKLAMARAAVEMLIAGTAEGPPRQAANAATQRVLPHELVVRDSTSAPPRRAVKPARR